LADRINLPKDPDLARQVLDAQGKAAERGMLGKIFGTKDHAPTNIAAMALFLMIALFVAILFVPLDDSIDRGPLIATILSTITFIIGVVFGRESN